jgi:hypothetical protein
VLCGLDLGPAAVDTLAYAAAVTDAFDADLLVLHVAGESGVEDVWAAVEAAVATTSARSGRVRQEVVAGAGRADHGRGRQGRKLTSWSSAAWRWPSPACSRLTTVHCCAT